MSWTESATGFVEKRGKRTLKRIEYTHHWRFPAVVLFMLTANFLLHGCAVQKKSVPLSPVEERIEKSPADSLLGSAEQALRLDQFNQAEMFLERALRLEPRNGELWHAMGQVKFEQNHHAQAVQFCLKSNSLAGKAPLLIRKNWILMEKAYLQMGETEQAEACGEPVIIRGDLEHIKK